MSIFAKCSSRLIRAAAAGLAAAVVLGLASCATFPSNKVSLDMTEIGVPVMLTKVEAKAATKTFDFQSGFSSVSITTSNRMGNTSVSTTMTSAQTINRPLDAQLTMGFIQPPAWFAVTSLDLYTAFWSATAATRKENRIDMSIAVPAAQE
jgi:hypothetical protein